MSTVADLMGLGMPGPLASRIGNTPTSQLGVGTTIGGSLIQTTLTSGDAESGQTAFTLPAGASLGRPFYFYNSGAATALIFPPDANGTIDAGSGGASYSVATHIGAVFIRISATAWMAIKSA